MFEQKLTHITMAGQDLPIKLDNFVLAKIQEKYEKLEIFEMEIKGLRPEKDAKGKIVTKLENKVKQTVYKNVDPSIKAINFVLPLMVIEGMEIEGKKVNFTEQELVRAIDIPYFTLANIISGEYKKCFQSKNHKPTQQEM